MNIPLFWAKGTASDTDDTGKPLELTCWRWSSTSAEDARANAFAAAAKAIRTLRRDQPVEHYWYARGPLREEVIERFTDSRGALFAAVTRNRYGTLVLNSAGVMFLDWDAPRNSRQSLFNSIKKLFGRKTNPADDRFETETREKLARFRVENGEWTVRLYQTAGGLRGMVTHMLFDPAAASTLGTLKALGNDPLYIRLCESQSSFRARLTPKPWRCGAGKCTLAWPREGDTIVRFDRWVTRYDRRRAAFATCRFIDTIGPGAVHPEIAPIVELHDTLTRSSELLPLA